jgi:hypothetical protein
MRVTHHHILGALGASAALIAYLNSPPAQKLTMQYLKMIKNGIVELAYNLRNAAESVDQSTPPTHVVVKKPSQTRSQ